MNQSDLDFASFDFGEYGPTSDVPTLVPLTPPPANKAISNMFDQVVLHKPKREAKRSARKLAKNNREKKRRVQMNAYFMQLSKLITIDPSAKKAEKCSILNDAIAMIMALREQNQKLENQTSALETDLTRMQTYVKGIRHGHGKEAALPEPPLLSGISPSSSPTSSSSSSSSSSIMSSSPYTSSSFSHTPSPAFDFFRNDVVEPASPCSSDDYSPPLSPLHYSTRTIPPLPTMPVVAHDPMFQPLSPLPLPLEPLLVDTFLSM